MQVQVDQDLCISCGLCVSNCPDVFDWNVEEKAVAKAAPVPAKDEECCRDSIAGCPTQAISET